MKFNFGTLIAKHIFYLNIFSKAVRPKRIFTFIFPNKNNFFKNGKSIGIFILILVKLFCQYHLLGLVQLDLVKYLKSVKI